MSGHSKWASIKHKKAATDAKRGKLFTKLARAITVAAREGGGDPEANSTLATAVQKARDQSMPKDNIQRAIDRGTGEGADGVAIERILYEGYGPGGVAILVEALTDNRNRTSAEIRHAFDQPRRQPRRAGLGRLDLREARRDPRRRRPLRRGRPDRRDRRRRRGRVDDDGTFRRSSPRPATSPPSARRSRRPASRSSPPRSRWSPKSTVEVEEGQAQTLLRLIDALEEHDDVDAVHANFDISEEVMERALA